MTVAMPAPGGYGKSTVLTELARIYVAAGMRVLGPADVPAETDRPSPSPVRRGPRRAARRRRPPTRPRPCWTISSVSSRRCRADGRGLPPVAAAGRAGRPGRAARPDWAAAAARAVGPRPRGRVSGRPHGDAANAAAGGLRGDADRWRARFVAHLGAALEAGSGWAEQAEPQLPSSAIAALRPDLDRLDPEVERYLLAVEAGVGRHGRTARRAAGPGRRRRARHHGRGAGHRPVRCSDGTLLPIARRAVSVLVPAERRIDVRQRLAELQRARGGPVLDLARSLLGTGVGGAGVAAVFEAAALRRWARSRRWRRRCSRRRVAAGTPLADARGWLGAGGGALR